MAALYLSVSPFLGAKMQMPSPSPQKDLADNIRYENF
jgi:hypothetical protein